MNRLFMTFNALVIPVLIAYLAGLLPNTAAVEFSSLNNAYSPPYYPAPIGGRLSTAPDWDEAYDRAREFVADLSLVEKVNLTTGVGWMQGYCLGNSGDIPRKGFRGLCLQDGPLGVRSTDYNTAFPPGVAAGATFNKDLMYLRAKAIGREFRDKGVDIVLGPSTGPLGLKAAGGRNWEGFGADPYLQGVAGALSVQGIQDQGVMATAKHYVGNEQEHFRQYHEWRDMYGFSTLKEPLSSNIDDRTLHEVYAWPFADMVHAGVGSVMCSYNQVNNSGACQNSYLLNGVLKDELGFEGFVMSDWAAQRSGMASILAGLDMNMPGDSDMMGDGASYMGANLTAGVMNGTIPEERIDDMATRIMAAYFKVGLDKTRDRDGYDGPNLYSWSLKTEDLVYQGSGEGPKAVVNHHVDVQTDLSESSAFDVAQEAIALLKNSGSLPLDAQEISRLAILGSVAGSSPKGPNCHPDMACDSGPFSSGWGSGTARFPFVITPLEAINDRATEEGIVVDYNLENTVTDSFIETASLSDVNLIFAGANSGEGYLQVDGNLGDRRDFSLWYNADRLIQEAARVNSNNIIVITSVGPVNLERWIDHPNVTAVLFTPPAGQYGGSVISNVLFGDYNPSGRLPFTIAKRDEHYIPLVDTVPLNGLPQDNFDTGIYIDYRLFEKEGIEPRYTFGYGLSYSNWSIDSIKVNTVNEPSEQLPTPPQLRPVQLIDRPALDPNSVLFPENFSKVNKFNYPYVDNVDLLAPRGKYPYPDGYTEKPRDGYGSLAAGGPGGNPELWKTVYTVSTTVTNHGPYDGAHVVQLYVEYPESKRYPTPRQLRGFDKVYLMPGQTTTVDLNLLWRDLAVWDVVSQSWIVQRGTYKFYLGTNSRDFEQVQTITIS
uniref:beta-glucosidase n=1 Tax=Blastobotrys adeninivorans TaxID=409370 RepID=A0A060T8N7_BLAAD